MASAADMRFSPRRGTERSSGLRVVLAPPRMEVDSTGSVGASDDPRAGLVDSAVGEFKERRRRRRVAVDPMYTWVHVRLLGVRDVPLEGHVLDISETGMAVQVDEPISIGQAVTLEFTLAGLGSLRRQQWPMYAVAGQVVRMDDLEEFPQGPYRMAVKFMRIPTMVQAQIARFVATPPARAV